MPNPHIYAYSTDATNDVGAEYIIEAKVTGVPLASVWSQWDSQARLRMNYDLMAIQDKIRQWGPFWNTPHGCIYYKKDLEQKSLPAKTWSIIGRSLTRSIK